MRCGPVDKIVSVGEPGHCEYLIKVEAPAACSRLDLPTFYGEEGGGHTERTEPTNWKEGWTWEMWMREEEVGPALHLGSSWVGPLVLLWAGLLAASLRWLCAGNPPEPVQPADAPAPEATLAQQRAVAAVADVTAAAAAAGSGSGQVPPRTRARSPSATPPADPGLRSPKRKKSRTRACCTSPRSAA